MGRADDNLSCDEAMQLVRAFVGGAEDARMRPRMRSHLARCERCSAAYREIVESLARFSRAVNDDESSAAKPRAARVTDSNEDPEPDRPPKRRANLIAADPGHRFRLPKLFLPLAAVCALFAVTRTSDAPRLVLRAIAGEITSGHASVHAGDAAQALERGTVVASGEGGRAELAFGTNAVVLEASSAVLVDRVGSLALRLFVGRVHVRGDATIATPSGVVEASGGDADVEIVVGRVVIHAVRGTVSLVDGTGTHAIEPGSTASFESPLALTRRE